MKRPLLSILCFALAGATAAPLWAQSLADVSKKEEDRRKNIKEPSKVYTNKDLPSVPASTTEPASDQTTDADKTAADSAKGDDKAADKGKDKDKDAKDKAVKDQAYWSSRQQTLQTQLDHDQEFAEALQTRINSLNTDFVNRDDPAQRATIGATRDKSIADLGRLKLAIEKDKQALADLQEEARRAGVPPGWLR
jgi:hypothetical protein